MNPEHIAQHKELYEGNAGIGQQAAEQDQRQGELFSWLYRPGATKAQIWYMIQGSASSTATIINT